MSTQTELLLIYTGGTIGMVEDAETGALHPIDFSQLEKEIPELKKFDCNITVKSLIKPIDSSNMNIVVWQELLEILESNYDSFDGFVIMHGSDTMAYTASAISFLLENVNKPIIFTGSQLPIGKIRTDGKENLITSIEIAAAKENGKPIVPEVALYFEYSLYRANRTTKVSAENFEAFQSPNYPLLAEAGVHIKYNRFAIRKWENKKLIARKSIIDHVASIKIFPGLRRDVFLAIANLPNLQGLILETFGSGNVPSDTWFSEEITRLNERGIFVLNITQCTTGSVIQNKYETGVHLERAGVISGKDMTFEAAITKLMYLLSCEELTDADKRSYLDKNIRGEIS